MTAVLPPDAIEAVAAELRRRLASPHHGYERQGAAAPPDPHGATPKAERVGRPVRHRVPAAPVRGRGRPVGNPGRGREGHPVRPAPAGRAVARGRAGRWAPRRPSRSIVALLVERVETTGPSRLSVGFPRSQRRPSSTPRCCHRQHRVKRHPRTTPASLPEPDPESRRRCRPRPVPFRRTRGPGPSRSTTRAPSPPRCSSLRMTGLWIELVGSATPDVVPAGTPCR